MRGESFQREWRGLLSTYVGRPTPLTDAKRLARAIDPEGKTLARVLLKREDLCHTGAHKINNALGQVLLAKKMGKTRIIAETGAGQHGVATATACALFGLPCEVYMGEEDVRRQAPNVGRMRLLGANVVPVTSGSRTLKDAMNEALRDWVTNVRTTHYCIGSAAGPHPYPELVATLQSVIGEESRAQMLAQAGGLPDAAVACVGGGSNAIGMFRGFMKDPSVALVGVEAAGHGVASGKHAATLTAGRVGVLHGSKSYVLCDDEGQIQEAHSISAGLDYPGVGPEHSWLKDTGRAKYVSATDDEALAAAALVTKTEGIIPALETSHAFAKLGAIGRDLAAKRGRPVTLVVASSGRGDKDLETLLAHFGTPTTRRQRRSPMRIEETFAQLAAAKKKALVAYLCVGDPSVEESVDLAVACVEAGADVLELGVPFSDPTADGPAIARASQRAIAHGGGLSATLRAAKAVRARTTAPIVLFGYYNPLFVRGDARAVAEAADAGVDALLVVDLPAEEGGELRAAAASRGLSIIPLLAPTSSPARVEAVRKATPPAAFVYYVSVTGVTGSQEAPLAKASEEAAAIRRVVGVPVVVGFGIDSPEKARAAATHADGVVVGTALVRAIEGRKKIDRRLADATAVHRLALDRPWSSTAP